MLPQGHCRVVKAKFLPFPVNQSGSSQLHAMRAFTLGSQGRMPALLYFIFLYTCVYILSVSSLRAQNLPEPADYLSRDFHKQRREALRNLMPEHSVMVIFSYPERVFSRDINYVYHQNPDMYYFSGYNEPNAVLFIFKEMQQDGGSSYNEVFFVQKKDSAREIWTGKRLGAEGTKTRLGFDRVFTSDQFDSLCPDLSKLSVINSVITDDIAYNMQPGSLYNLLEVFRKKANIPRDAYQGPGADLMTIAQHVPLKYLSRYIAYVHLEDKVRTDDAYKNNELIREVMNHPDSASFEAIKKKINPTGKKPPFELYNEYTCTLREIKTPEELALLRKAVFISGVAHAEVMKAIRPDMSERELEGIFSYVHHRYGAEEEGYGPIVGAGANGCILHYEENSVTDIKSSMVTMDVAAEYHGYSADITRSVPSTGKYTPEQKAIYQLVYDAQEAIFLLCKEGTPFGRLDSTAKAVLAAGLIKLGVLKDPKDIGTYYPHGCSHHMGLDVHDKSNYGALKANMVITVEPGIYIPAGSKCDKKWWDIGVRIEDDVVIGKERCELLSASAPRKWDDVERMVGQKSALNNISLPPLK
jgi:Xaa-Pro aminopeptidase